MSMNIAGRLSTDTSYLSDLIADIDKGEIKVPKFQRPFVWNAEQALDLLDSIANSFPVGSLLLWKTKDKLVAERNIGDFKLPETADLTPTLYVLDGQQRLTVIYSCLAASLGDEGFTAAYNLDSEEFIELPDTPHLHTFPLRLCFDTSDLLNFRTALMAHPNHDVLQPRLDNLIGALQKYKVPVVTLKELTVEEVCPIFERINSSGTRLSTYDLMVAATWSENFDLDDEAESITAALRPKGFDDLDKSTVLKCLAAINKSSIKKEDVLGLRELPKMEMESIVERVKEALLKSVDLLSTEFGIYSWDFLPYEALVIILSVVFDKKGSLSPDEVTRIRIWFWRSAFSQRYRGASESYISRDIDTVFAFVSDGGSSSSFGDAITPDSLKRVNFRSNNSRARALILMLAKSSPRNLTNGAAIDVSDALSIFNKKQFHHIHPRAYLKRISAPGEHNALANICMLIASENNSVGDNDPRVYLPQCIDSLGADAEAVFESNLLPDAAVTDYSIQDYSSFLEERAKILAARAAELCNGKAT